MQGALGRKWLEPGGEKGGQYFLPTSGGLAGPKASSSEPPQTSIFLGWGVSDSQMMWTVKTAGVSEWCWGQEEAASGRRPGAANSSLF